MRLSKILIVGFMTIVFVFLPGRQAAAAESIDGFKLNLDAGYRTDELDWNIAGGISGPNIISEVTWDDLEIYQVRGGVKLNIGGEAAPVALNAKAMVAYGWIVDGENQDSDFDGDNRTLEVSRSNNNADDGEVVDVSVGVGPRFKVWTDKLAITPLLGISYHEQNLTLTDGLQTIATDNITPPLGPFPGLDGTYETQWCGPWAGIDVALRLVEKITLSGNFEYHWANFESEANWNLRNDLAHPKSFDQEADGEGVVLSLGGKYDLTDHFSIHLSFDYQNWQAEDGVIRFFPTSGGLVVQRLNEVNWKAQSVMVGVTYRLL